MLAMSEKLVIWLGDSRETIRGFPDDVRRIAGFQLRRVQRGLEPIERIGAPWKR
jgi:phage-related protein